MSIEKLPVFENFPDEDPKLSKLIKWIKDKIFQPISKRVNFLLSLVNSGFVEIPADGVAPGADGNWRWRAEDGCLILQNKVAGEWVDVGIKFNPDGSVTVFGVLVTESGRVVNTTRLTSNTTLDETYDNVFCDTDGGAFTVTLPAGVDGTKYRILNTGTSGNIITISPDGSELLVGVNSSIHIDDFETIILTYETTEGWN